MDWYTPALNGNNNLNTAISQMAKFYVSALMVEINSDIAGSLCDSDLLQSVICGENLSEITVAEVMIARDLMTEEGAVNPCAHI